MRHMGRTWGVSLSWLNGQLRAGNYSLGYIKTDEMAADIFTKFYPKGKKSTWEKVTELIGVMPGPDWTSRFGQEGHGHAAAVARMPDDSVKPTSACVVEPPDPEMHPYLDAYNPFVDDGGDPLQNDEDNRECDIPQSRRGRRLRMGRCRGGPVAP